VTRLLGAILAGGQSSRFGSDKAAALLGEMPLIEHVRAALTPHVDAVVVCGGDAGALPDRPAAGLGPLGGLCAALIHARARGYDAVLSAGCDTPLLPAELLRQLAAAKGAAYVAELPILGLWPVALGALLEAHLATGGDRSVRGFARLAGAVAITSPAPIANINRPEDLARLASTPPS